MTNLLMGASLLALAKSIYYFSKLLHRVLESVFRLAMWFRKDQGTRVFELGLNGSGLRLLIFHKMSPRTHHNYLQQNHCTRSVLKS